MTKGRPSIYTEELAEEICEAIATSSKGVRRLCEENPHFPNQNTVFKWLRTNEKFNERYACAKRHQVEVLVDEILVIADDGSNDMSDTSDGRVNHDHISRSKLRIDTRKWLACKLIPRVYGISPKDDLTDTLIHEDFVEKMMEAEISSQG